MQMIEDALLPEALDPLRKMFEREESEELKRDRIAVELRRKRDQAAEAADRARFERVQRSRHA